jgi:hypothetical protein
VFYSKDYKEKSKNKNAELNTTKTTPKTFSTNTPLPHVNIPHPTSTDH